MAQVKLKQKPLAASASVFGKEAAAVEQPSKSNYDDSLSLVASLAILRLLCFLLLFRSLHYALIIHFVIKSTHCRACRVQYSWSEREWEDGAPTQLRVVAKKRGRRRWVGNGCWWRRRCVSVSVGSQTRQLSAHKHSQIRSAVVKEGRGKRAGKKKKSNVNAHLFILGSSALCSLCFLFLFSLPQYCLTFHCCSFCTQTRTQKSVAPLILTPKSWPLANNDGNSSSSSYGTSSSNNNSGYNLAPETSKSLLGCLM